MPFPIWWEGQILFRYGKPAMSLACCCDQRDFIVQEYIYELSFSATTINDIDFGDPMPTIASLFGTLGGTVDQSGWLLVDCIRTVGYILLRYYVTMCRWEDDNVVASDIAGVLEAYGMSFPEFGYISYFGTGAPTYLASVDSVRSALAAGHNPGGGGDGCDGAFDGGYTPISMTALRCT